MSEKPREPIKLNRAEGEGLRRVSAERDQRLREANDLDQYLRQLTVELITCRGGDLSEGWTLDLPNNQIVPTEPPTKAPKKSAKKQPAPKKEAK